MNQTFSKPNWLAFSLISIFVVFLISLLVYLLIFRNLPSLNGLNPLAAKPKPVAAISITKDGFTPQEIQIRKGTIVTWTNNDTSNHQVASDPFPMDNNLKEIGKGRILSPNDVFSFTFDTEGTFTYHDELNPFRLKGTVVVK